MLELTEETTLNDVLAGAVSTRGVGARFLDRHMQPEEHSFGELHGRSLRAAGVLRRAGVAPGDVVVIITPTCVEFYDAFFGALQAGAVPAPLYPPVRLGKMDDWVERTAQMIERAGAGCVVADARTRRVMGRVMERLSGRFGGVLAAETLAQGEPLESSVQTVSDEPALIQFSSGTTREPAPVVLTHRQIIANVRAIRNALPEESFSAGGCVSWLPLYHDMGLIGCVLTALASMQPITLLPPELFLARPVRWLEAISTYRGTVSPAPNFAYARCAEKVSSEDLESLDLSSWVVAMNGAEPIDIAAVRAFEDTFESCGLRRAAMSPVYGLSEAALAVTFPPLDERYRSVVFERERLAADEAIPADEGIELPSLGAPLPGYELEIRSSAGAVAAERRVGQIWVRGPSLTSGYMNSNGQLDSPLVEGWLDTGDRGFMHEGELYVCGRAKDVVVVRGRNHPAHSIERAVSRLEDIRTGCVVAVSDITAGGECVIVMAETRKPSAGLEQQAHEAVVSTTGIRPDAIVLLGPGTLPRTSSGKLRRQHALRQYRCGELKPPRSVGPMLLASEFLKSMVGYARS